MLGFLVIFETAFVFVRFAACLACKLLWGLLSLANCFVACTVPFVDELAIAVTALIFGQGMISPQVVNEVFSFKKRFITLGAFHSKYPFMNSSLVLF